MEAATKIVFRITREGGVYRLDYEHRDCLYTTSIQAESGGAALLACLKQMGYRDDVIERAGAAVLVNNNPAIVVVTLGA